MNLYLLHWFSFSCKITFMRTYIYHQDALYCNMQWSHIIPLKDSEKSISMDVSIHDRSKLFRSKLVLSQAIMDYITLLSTCYKMITNTKYHHTSTLIQSKIQDNHKIPITWLSFPLKDWHSSSLIKLDWVSLILMMLCHAESNIVICPTHLENVFYI